MYHYDPNDIKGPNAPAVGYPYGIIIVARSHRDIVLQAVFTHQKTDDGGNVLFRVRYGNSNPWQVWRSLA
ncbi:MAG: hypothetical protein HFJ75_10550 [Eggerthellaceae bacterium]|nr:hypothetical protein [Eggerthellaceae bacterium]